jgi:hypothetical protein
MGALNPSGVYFQMKKDITLEEAIKKLKKAGYPLEKEKDKYKWKSNGSAGAYGPNYYTEREIYKLYNDVFRDGPSYKKDVKHLTNGKDRAAKRDLINKEEFDNIPSKKRIKEEDLWDYA